MSALEPGRAHRRPSARLLVTIGVVVVLGLGLWGLDAALRPHDDGVGGSGTIEGEESPVSAEIAARISELLVDEGAAVEAGAVVARLDDTQLKSQLAQAQAALETARASLRLVEAGARPEEVRQAQATLAQAEAARDAAERGWRHSQAQRTDPQELTARINSAETQVSAAKARLDLVKGGPREGDLAMARAAVASARTGLAETEANTRAREKAAAETVAAAESRLRLLTQGARPEDVRAAEIALEQAKNALYAAQANRDGICIPQRPKYMCDSAEAQVAAAESNVSAATNALARVRNGALPDEIKVAESNLKQAQANLDAARATAAPEVAAARSNVQATESRLQQLESGSTAEEIAIATASLEQTQRNLADLKAMRDNPLLANAQVDAAKGQFDAAAAAVDVARAKLDALRAGATAEQLAVARAQVQQAEAAVAGVKTQLDRTTLVAPGAGIVSKRSGRVGDVTTPGYQVATIVNTRALKLTVYINEPRMGGVKLGQQALVTVDAYPDQQFAGEVIFISPRAEFTPRNTQTQRDRATTVFAVKLRLPNDDGRLKPGMPADASLR